MTFRYLKTKQINKHRWKTNLHFYYSISPSCFSMKINSFQKQISNFDQNLTCCRPTNLDLWLKSTGCCVYHIINTLLKPKRHSLRCHDFLVHAYLLRMCTNVVDFRVMRRLRRREWNEIDRAWTNIPGIHDPGGGGHFHIEGDGDVPLDRVCYRGHQY